MSWTVNFSFSVKHIEVKCIILSDLFLSKWCVTRNYILVSNKIIGV